MHTYNDDEPPSPKPLYTERVCRNKVTLVFEGKPIFTATSADLSVDASKDLCRLALESFMWTPEFTKNVNNQSFSTLTFSHRVVFE